VVVIPSSTYCGVFQGIALPTRTGPSAEPLRIGAYGRYHEQKGFGNLIKAMRLLPSDAVTLTLAGLGPYQESLTAMAADMPNVTVGGPTSDVPGFLRGVDIVGVPSRWESFGQTALEARAAGRPLIASSVDGLVEQTDAAWGWLVAEDDIDGLAAALRAASNANLTVMGQAARISAEGHLEASLNIWRNLAAELLRLEGAAPLAKVA
jgi:glycosyltransferase involved in cell wall biosynthesis